MRLSAVLPPRGVPRCAALVVAVQQSRLQPWQQFAIGAVGLRVRGARPVLVGQNDAEVVCGGVFVATPYLVDFGAGGDADVLVVGFTGDRLVDERVVFVFAAGHADVGHGAGCFVAEHGEAGTACGDVADGDALGGMQCGGVTQGDVPAQIVAFEDDAGGFGEPPGGTAVGGIDADHAPAVAVADLVDPVATAVLCARFDSQRRVVVAADDDVAGVHVLVTRHPHPRGGRVGVDAVEATAEQSFEWVEVGERTGMAEIAGVTARCIKASSRRSTRPSAACAPHRTAPRILLDRTRLARMGAHIDKPAFTRAELVELVGALLPVDAPEHPRALIERIVAAVSVRVSATRQAHHREGYELFTVDAVIAEEERNYDMIDAADTRTRLDVRAADLGDLSADQTRAIGNIANSHYLVQPLQAPAGAGKTHSLKALRAAAHRANKEVLVLAPTGKAVDEAMSDGAGDRGLTVAKALQLIEDNQLDVDRRTVVVVDEASMRAEGKDAACRIPLQHAVVTENL